MVDEAIESFKNLIKKILQQERHFFPIERVKFCIEKVWMQYRIDANDWIDPDLFLVNSKQSITNLLITTRQTKVKLILSCMMDKVDLKSGEVIVKEAAFHYKTEVKLESTICNELFSKTKETVLVSLAKFFKEKGRNWRFRSVFSLDLHMVKYEPFGGSSYIPLQNFLAAKKAIINLKNEDEERFKWGSHEH